MNILVDGHIQVSFLFNFPDFLFLPLEEHADDVRDTASHLIVWQILSDVH